MKLSYIGNAERSVWPTTCTHLTTGTLSVVDVGGANPAAPSPLEDCTKLVKLAADSAYMRNVFTQHRSIRTLAYVYLGVTAIGADNLKFYISSSFDGHYQRQSRVTLAFIRGAEGYYKITATVTNRSNGTIVTANLKDIGGINDLSVAVASPAWYFFDIQQTLDSAVGEADGSLKVCMYREDGGLIVGQYEYAGTMDIGYFLEDNWVCRTGSSTIVHYIADWTTYGNVNGDIEDDVPGLYAVIPHSADRDAGTCRIRCVLDRACTAVLTYGEAGTEDTATPVTLDDSDSGRIVEFELTGLEPDTYYKYQVQLAQETNTHTWTSFHGDTDEFKILPCPSSDAVVAGIIVTDSHLVQKSYPGRLEEYSQVRGVKGPPTLCLLTGDIWDNGFAGTGTTEVIARLLMPRALDCARSIMASTIVVPVYGNHEFDGTAASDAYCKAVFPAPQSDVFAREYGPGEVFSFPDNVVVADAAAAALIEGELTDKINASSAPWKIFQSHCSSADFHTANTVSEQGAFDEANTLSRAAILALLEANPGIISVHGHAHEGNWWIKNDVLYITSPPYQGQNTKSLYGVFANDTGDPGSLVNSIGGFGGETGAAGWVYFVLAPNWARFQIYDSYFDDSNNLSVSKRLDQHRLVA